jgi:hypothetical protein
VPGRPVPKKKPKQIEFHVMKFGATPARLVAVVHATDEKAALEQAIARHRIPPHLQKRLIVVRRRPSLVRFQREAVSDAAQTQAPDVSPSGGGTFPSQPP